MNEKLFRKKSLDKIASPEQLNDYISVTTPGVWMLMVSIILILIGVIVWGTLAELDTKIKAPALVHEKEATLYVEAKDILDLSMGKKVRIAGVEGEITCLHNESMKAEDVLGDFALTDAGYDPDTIVYPVYADIDIQDGIYTADVIIDRVSPISFLINDKGERY